MESRNSAPLASFIDLLLDAVCAVDKQGRFVFVSAACERIFGYTPEELIGRQMIELVHPADRQRTLAAAHEIMGGDPKHNFENRYVRKDGSVAHILWSARWSEVDQLRIAVARDITERKQAESRQAALYAISEAAHAAEDLLALFKRIHLIIGEWLPALNFSVALYDEHCAQAEFPLPRRRPRIAARATGHGHRTSVHASDPQRSADPADTGQSRCLSRIRRAGGRAGFTLLARRAVELEKRHHRRTDRQRACPAASATPSRTRNCCNTSAPRSRLPSSASNCMPGCKRMAQYDQLTQLPNRELLRDRLKAALASAREAVGHMALLYVDLDRFKQVNDTFGHAVGDMLLQTVANRLKGCVRETDTVARIGGDEFVVLLHSVHVAEDADSVAQKIRQVLVQPMRLDGHNLHIEPSIGVARYPEHGSEEQQLFRHADQAMYAAKRLNHRALDI